MQDMELNDLNPVLHNELRLKVMVALDALDDADFVYLKGLTKATSGNLSVQLSNLEDAGYISVNSSGRGRGSHTVCSITPEGIAALQEYQRALMSYFPNWKSAGTSEPLGHGAEGLAAMGDGVLPVLSDV